MVEIKQDWGRGEGKVRLKFGINRGGGGGEGEGVWGRNKEVEYIVAAINPVYSSSDLLMRFICLAHLGRIIKPQHKYVDFGEEFIACLFSLVVRNAKVWIG